MKRAGKTEETKRKFEELLSKLSENEIVNLQAMIRIKGGDGEGNGSEPIITPPPKIG